MVYLALDFGGSSVKYALVSNQAEILWSEKKIVSFQETEDFAEFVANIYKNIHEPVSGIAISIPGIIDYKTGFHNGSGAYAQILKGKNIISLLKNRCNTNISVENDGKWGALSEAWNGALEDVFSGAVIILGTGIGGGLVYDKRILHGLNYGAGEFSYIISENKGYSLMSEAFMHASAFGMTYKACKRKNLDFRAQENPALLERFDRLLAPYFQKPLGEPAFVRADGKQIMEWVREGDPDSVQIYKDLIHALSVVIMNVQAVFAPERFVIGGGLSRIDLLISDVQNELSEVYRGGLVPESLHSTVVRSKYLDECNLLGATFHHIQQYGG